MTDDERALGAGVNMDYDPDEDPAATAGEAQAWKHGREVGRAERAHEAATSEVVPDFPCWCGRSYTYHSEHWGLSWALASMPLAWHPYTEKREPTPEVIEAMARALWLHEVAPMKFTPDEAEYTENHDYWLASARAAWDAEHGNR